MYPLRPDRSEIVATVGKIRSHGIWFNGEAQDEYARLYTLLFNAGLNKTEIMSVLCRAFKAARLELQGQ